MASDDETTAAKKIFQDQSGFRYETDVFKDKIFDLVKAIAKLLVLFYVIYNELSDEWGMVVNIYSLDLTSALQLLVNAVINIGLKISFVFLILAAVDYYYQRRKFKNDMKMTKQEVKRRI